MFDGVNKKMEEMDTVIFSRIKAMENKFELKFEDIYNNNIKII
jgi:hypothetical protein